MNHSTLSNSGGNQAQQSGAKLIQYGDFLKNFQFLELQGLKGLQKSRQIQQKSTHKLYDYYETDIRGAANIDKHSSFCEQLFQLQNANLLKLHYYSRVFAAEWIGDPYCQFFQIFQYCETSLDNLMQHQNQKGQSFKKQQLKVIVESIAGALDFLHTRGIMHNNLLPNKVMVNPKGQFKLLPPKIGMRQADEFYPVAPEQYQKSKFISALERSNEVDSLKAEMFTFGMLILRIGLYNNFKQAYCKFTFNRQIISEALRQFLMQHGYHLTFIVNKLLDEDPKQRPDAAQIPGLLNSTDLQNMQKEQNSSKNRTSQLLPMISQTNEMNKSGFQNSQSKQFLHRKNSQLSQSQTIKKNKSTIFIQQNLNMDNQNGIRPQLKLTSLNSNSFNDTGLLSNDMSGGSNTNQNQRMTPTSRSQDEMFQDQQSPSGTMTMIDFTKRNSQSEKNNNERSPNFHSIKKMGFTPNDKNQRFSQAYLPQQSLIQHDSMNSRKSQMASPQSSSNLNMLNSPHSTQINIKSQKDYNFSSKVDEIERISEGTSLKAKLSQSNEAGVMNSTEVIHEQRRESEEDEIENEDIIFRTLPQEYQDEIDKQISERIQDIQGMYVIQYLKGGHRYQGIKMQGKPNEFGIFWWANGDCYEGQFDKGKYNGIGIYYWANGAKHYGQFRYGEIQGLGVRFYSDGGIYFGEWRRGLNHGKGTFYWNNNAQFIGHFFKDKIYGKGSLVTNDNGADQQMEGRRYEGMWKDEKSSGISVDQFDFQSNKDHLQIREQKNIQGQKELKNKVQQNEYEETGEPPKKIFWKSPGLYRK